MKKKDNTNPRVQLGQGWVAWRIHSAIGVSSRQWNDSLRFNLLACLCDKCFAQHIRSGRKKPLTTTRLNRVYFHFRSLMKTLLRSPALNWSWGVFCWFYPIHYLKSFTVSDPNWNFKTPEAHQSTRLPKLERQTPADYLKFILKRNWMRQMFPTMIHVMQIRKQFCENCRNSLRTLYDINSDRFIEFWKIVHFKRHSRPFLVVCCAKSLTLLRTFFA